MSDQTYERVVNHPKFAELTAKRNSFSLVLSLIVLGVYYTFVLVAALKPALFSAPVFEGVTWPMGLAAGFVIQMFAFAMTGVYVARANSEFDALNRTIIEESTR
ncbi:MAG TPA: DUF485 domain-containing protein [Candidatus Omnitrophota bacterium]|nr:DUF485 domain-containing protein [Candidatus Omnitrophota bacterium]